MSDGEYLGEEFDDEDGDDDFPDCEYDPDIEAWPERLEIQDGLEIVREFVRQRLLSQDSRVLHGDRDIGTVSDTLRELTRLCLDGVGVGQIYIVSKLTGEKIRVGTMRVEERGDGPVLVCE